MRNTLSIVVIVSITSTLLAVPLRPAHDELVITLHAENTTVAMDQPVKITVRFTNRGKEPVIVVKPVTNCDRGMCLVNYKWSLIRDESPIDRMPRKFCKDEPFKSDDFLTIRPGESVNVACEEFHFFEHGKHLIGLEYTLDVSKLGKRGTNSATDEAAKIIKKLSNQSVSSQAITIHHEVPFSLRPVRSRIEMLNRDYIRAIATQYFLTADAIDISNGEKIPGKSIAEIARLSDQARHDEKKLLNDLHAAKAEHAVLSAINACEKNFRIGNSPDVFPLYDFPTNETPRK